MKGTEGPYDPALAQSRFPGMASSSAWNDSKRDILYPRLLLGLVLLILTSNSGKNFPVDDLSQAAETLWVEAHSSLVELQDCLKDVSDLGKEVLLKRKC